MIRRIHLHGQLGKRFGRVHEYDIDTPAEAVHALANTIPGFREYFQPRRYAITTGSGQAVCEGTLSLRMGKQRDLHITPAGAMSGIETVLLVGALVLSVATAVISLAMMPKAKKPGDRESETKIESYLFDGPQNRTEQGHPVPLVYGKMRVGSVVVSAGIATTDINQTSAQQSSGYAGTSPGIYGSPFGNEWITLEKGGKSGGSSRAAQEDPNSLQSQATARIIDAVSEGEIGGLVDGLKSVYFDDTPLQNPDDSFNFSGVVVDERVGLPDQDYIPGFTQTEGTTAVDTQVTVLAGPVTRTITDPDVTLARVTIGIPQLFQQDTTNGDLKKTTVQFRIAVQHNGGGFTTVVDKTFTEKTNSPYQCSFDVALPAGTGPHDIRVTRVTPDSDVASVSNDTYWDLLTEIVEAKLSYPDTALYGLTVDARQFGSNIPTRSYEIYGLIVEVPTNYDPETRVYTGVWDGTFKRAWTDNPAWVYRDLVTNRRYGCGSRIPASSVDKWTLYAISQYNDELIDDGFGGTRPRYTCNCVIDTEIGVYDLLNSITSIFRSWAYWSTGGIVVAQDRPETPSVLVTPANVVDGLIEYSRLTDLEQRRSVVVIYWNDPSDGYRLTPEIVERPDLIRRFGWRPGEPLTAFGCTDQSQARRMGLWVFEDEGESNTAATYQVGDDHSFVQPGQIAVVTDPMFVAERRGGRVKAATSGTLTLDGPVTLASGQSYTARVTMADGTVESRDVTTGAGTVTVLAVSPNWSAVPSAGAVWSIESDTVVSRQFRVRNITTDTPPYRVDTVIYDETKFARVELGVDLQPVNYINLPQGALQAPSGLSVSEFLFIDGTSVIPSVQVSWRSAYDPRIVFYQAQYLPPGGNWIAFADSLELSREVRGTSPGAWSFRVRGVDSLSRKTEWVQKTFVLDGSLAAIPNVTGLTLTADDDALTPMLEWTRPADVRPLEFEVFLGPDDVFANATSLGTTKALEWPVKQSGFYFVQSFFLTSKAASPPYLEITAAMLPEVKWSRVLGRPVTLADLDSIAAAVIAQNESDIADLYTTYGSTASAAASAVLAEAAAADAQSYSTSAQGYATSAQGFATAADDSASAAAISSGTAATYAGNAATSASAASGSASAASSSASTASTQASAASASASTASSSASTAATQAGIATTQAGTATTQASIATTQASAAQSSATLAATIARNSLNLNPVFNAWASPSGLPDNWTDWQSSASTRSRVTSLYGGYAFREQVSSSADAGIFAAYTGGLSEGLTPGWYVMEAEVKLVAGNLQSSGVQISWRDASSTVEADRLHFYTDPDSSGSVVGNGTVGKTYRFSKLVELTSTAAYRALLNIMTNYSVLNGTPAAKTLEWQRCSIRAATDQEIASGTIIPTLSASVTINSGAIATLQGKTAAYLELATAAGSSVAAVRLVSDSYAGSLLELQADAIRLGSAHYAAMAVVGSTVYFYGKVLANSITATEINVSQLDAISATIGTLRTATSGARMEIRDNVIKVYDSSNVLRVKIGNLAL